MAAKQASHHMCMITWMTFNQRLRNRNEIHTNSNYAYGHRFALKDNSTYSHSPKLRENLAYVSGFELTQNTDFKSDIKCDDNSAYERDFELNDNSAYERDFTLQVQLSLCELKVLVTESQCLATYIMLCANSCSN